VTHFSTYRHLIDDPTDKTIKYHVMNHMSNFELNPTVNESGKSILLKLCVSEKHTVAQRPRALAQRLCDAAEYEK